MRASVMPAFERQPTLADIPMPEAKPGEVLVRVHAASVNGIDLSIASGQLQGMLEYRFPVVLGKDFAGTVEAVGAGVTGFDAGERVFGIVSDPSPLSSRSFAEYLAVPAGPNLTRVPEGVDFAAAGVLGLTGAAALQAVDAVASAAGEVVLVSGATGGVGAYAVQLVAARSATVIATAAPGDEENFVRDLGASHGVDYRGDVAEQVRAIRPGGVEADHVPRPAPGAERERLGCIRESGRRHARPARRRVRGRPPEDAHPADLCAGPDRRGVRGLRRRHARQAGRLRLLAACALRRNRCSRRAAGRPGDEAASIGVCDRGVCDRGLTAPALLMPRVSENRECRNPARLRPYTTTARFCILMQGVDNHDQAPIRSPVKGCTEA